jgi:uncharacterized protein (DUF362 family)
MTTVSRRVFLRWLAATLGTTASAELLSACGAASTRDRPAPAPTQAAGPGSTAQPTPIAATATTTASTPTSAPADTPAPTAASASWPDLVVARGGEPDALVQQALAALGGIERFVKAGQDVIIKPNICVAYHTYEYAATTNPWVVGELVKLCLGAGAARVRVMDYPFGGTAEEAYAISGIKEQVEKAGGSMETMSRVKYVKTQLPNAQVLTECVIYDDALKTDVLIDVPIAKDHSLARLTLGMKNLMGLIQNREFIHYQMGEKLTDLTRQLHPSLTVVDAVRILMANGPTGGNLNDVKKLDTVIASADIVAADSYAATLFDLQPDDIDYVRVGAAAGLGRSDLKSLKIEEIQV